TAIRETLERSNLGDLKPGSLVNLERSMMMNGRLDGHIVQGHVDCTAECVDIQDADGSRYYKFVYDIDPSMIAKGYMTVEKGSVTVNGVSLTVCDSEPRSFRVAIIPFTFEHTNFRDIKVGDRVNLEFDIIGKYLARLAELKV
ncbi:MAG: riboflavin synthase, partial [Muribaculaceae bacterium]|nr:riboflavin synthase [Muribaculaceae bacterium]